ncbi:hypothetical protein L228DRAFT_103777 [Xylona heveae TC161]|uniref:Uncharacterized protein n=1 Tax=Xylona heveae (strain CBS 132557 / TC161) TaxID=1328760 RepID=A0A165IE49_XYLHT|nr:hypothetical protein L228DRAFT_103777 [Xylona heveae TC161]KZF24765.1 hypothetical protein L228DRAFT_103777 [Xylona heveae TC161]
MAHNIEKPAVETDVREIENESLRSPTLRPSPVREPSALLHTKASDDSLASNNLSRCTTTKDDETGQENPFSAFYCHPTTRCSFEQQRSESKLVLAHYDLEAQPSLPPSPERQPKECTMWPGRQTIKDRAKLEKKKREFRLFRKLSKKQIIWIKVVIALFIIALAVGLGLGISKAVGGGIWKSGS